MPGVLEEIIIAIGLNKPLYLLGGFGGVTQSVCNLFTGQSAQELTPQWQIDNNPGYADLLDVFNQEQPAETPDYLSLIHI